MSGRIAKVKQSGGFTTVCTVDKRDFANEKETTFKSSDEPHGDFIRALQFLEPHVRAILGWPAHYAEHELRITGVTFSWNDEKEVEGAVITGQVAMPTTDGPFVFNTPHLPFAQYNDGGQAKLMALPAQDALAELKAEAAAFVAGKRAQGSLFDTDYKPTPRGKMAAAEQAEAHA